MNRLVPQHRAGIVIVVVGLLLRQYGRVAVPAWQNRAVQIARVGCGQEPDDWHAAIVKTSTPVMPLEKTERLCNLRTQ